MNMLEKINSSLQFQIWRKDLDTLAAPRRHLIRAIRSFTVAVRGFEQHQCMLKASALTFYTLLSIVPVIAMLFGIAKGFGLEQRLEAEFKSDLSYNQEVIRYVFDFANSMLEDTRGGVIAGLGVVILFWTVMKMLGNIEETFNDIWGIRHPRRWTRKFSDYMSIMLLAPVLIIVSSSISVFIGTQLQSAANSIDMLGRVGPLIYAGLRLLPIVLSILLFTVLYIVLPNTPVNFSAALFGAGFAAAIVMIVEEIYVTFQVGVSRYNAIYGGFAALPLFLAWIQTNWLVVLFGAELSVAFQNRARGEPDTEPVDLSFSNRFVLAVAVVQALIMRFQKGEEGPGVAEIAEELRVPARLVKPVVDELIRCRVIAEVIGNNPDEARYIPAIDIAKLDLNFILRNLSDYGMNEIPETERLNAIEESVKKIQAEVADSKHNLLVKDL